MLFELVFCSDYVAILSNHICSPYWSQPKGLRAVNLAIYNNCCHFRLLKRLLATVVKMIIIPIFSPTLISSYSAYETAFKSSRPPRSYTCVKWLRWFWLSILVILYLWCQFSNPQWHRSCVFDTSSRKLSLSFATLLR
jgi:hypothetical protein